jgi:hypothetical protein
MKSTNKTLIAFGLIAATGLFFTSCNKTVTPRKLDGDWKVTSGSETYSYEDDNQETETTSTYNGTVMTTTGETDITGGGTFDIDQETNVTYDYLFNRETGEYTMTSVSSSTEEDAFAGGSYYEFDANLQDYVYAGTYIRTVERTSTSTETGYFTVTGDAGEDIEANSQIVFQMTSGTNDFTEVYSYKDADNNDQLSLSTTYVQEYNPNTQTFVYTKIDDEDSGSTTTSGSSASAPVWTVTELSGGEMMVEWTSETNFVDTEDSDNNYSIKTTTMWTLTEE